MDGPLSLVSNSTPINRIFFVRYRRPVDTTDLPRPLKNIPNVYHGLSTNSERYIRIIGTRLSFRVSMVNKKFRQKYKKMV